MKALLSPQTDRVNCDTVISAVQHILVRAGVCVPPVSKAPAKTVDYHFNPASHITAAVYLSILLIVVMLIMKMN